MILEPSATFIGTLNEDFAIESLAGDIFQLGNCSYRILRVEAGKVRVEDAKGQPPTLPFWLGEAPARSAELSAAVSLLRAEVDAALPSIDASSLARATAQIAQRYQLEQHSCPSSWLNIWHPPRPCWENCPHNKGSSTSASSTKRATCIW